MVFFNNGPELTRYVWLYFGSMCWVSVTKVNKLLCFSLPDYTLSAMSCVYIPNLAGKDGMYIGLAIVSINI